ncbi:YceI family protein [Aestuariivivens sediminis]|uniref:YceI family protein n=1 Tax=Aestuariivivens sediminis TaxID=2913557 RepID=UPI001F57833F|nr:YceI family protein [Aestuariivivens sediminis]
MKNHLLLVQIVLTLTILSTSCRKNVREAETGEAETVTAGRTYSETYKALPSESTITWSGYKPTGSHTGNIDLSHGEFTINDGTIESGTFTIDMTTIKDSERNAKLEKHLKSDDFLHVEKHPVSIFKITDIEDINGKTFLSGNLTLKDTTNNVSFPVSVIHNGDSIILNSETFTIDRSKWNVKYGSRTFFDNLGDKYINDDIELTIVVKGTKA